MRALAASAAVLVSLRLEAAPVAAAFLALPLSVRELGMGEVAPSETDVLSSWTNPARLNEQSARVATAAGGAAMGDGGERVYGLGAGWRTGGGPTLGAYLGGLAVSFPELGADGTDTGRTLGHQLVAFGLAAAEPAGPGAAGLAAKAVTEDVAGDRLVAFGADLGLSADVWGVAAGTSVRNLGGQLGTQRALPVEWRTEALYRHAGTGLAGGVAYSLTSGRSGRLGAGVEWRPLRAFSARAGIAGLEDRSRQVTAGLSGVVGGVGIDYALGLHPLGPAHRVSLSYAFGEVPVSAKAPAGPAAPAPSEAPAALAPSEAPAALAPAPSTATLLNVAIADLAPQGVSASDASVVADMLRTELARTGTCNVVERKNMEKILAEHAFQQTGCTSEECAVRLGRILNVQRMAVGSFGKLLESYVLTVRLVDVESGKVTSGDVVKGTSGAEIETKVRELAERLGRTLRPAP